MPPMTQKIAIAIAVFVIALGGVGYGIYAKTEENALLETEIEGLRNEIKGLDDIIATRAAREKEREQQQDVFKELVTILPQYSERQDENVLDSLTRYATVARLKPLGFIVKNPGNIPAAGPAVGGPPKPPGPGQAATPDFAQTELTLKYEGTYFNFLKFLSLVENHESFLRIDSFSLNPLPVAADAPEPEHRDLNITVRVSTFHYVSK